MSVRLGMEAPRGGREEERHDLRRYSIGPRRRCQGESGTLVAMNLTIRFEDGTRERALSAASEWTARRILEAVQVRSATLFHMEAGRELGDAETLAAAGVEEGDHLIVQARGAGDLERGLDIIRRLRAKGVFVERDREERLKTGSPQAWICGVP